MIFYRICNWNYFSSIKLAQFNNAAVVVNRDFAESS